MPRISEQTRAMDPLWMANDIMPVIDALRFLPWGRDKVYRLIRAGTIRVESHPGGMWITKEELARLRGRREAPATAGSGTGAG